MNPHASVELLCVLYAHNAFAVVVEHDTVVETPSAAISLLGLRTREVRARNVGAVLMRVHVTPDAPVLRRLFRSSARARKRRPH